MKILNDGTQVPPCIFYFLLDFKDTYRTDYFNLFKDLGSLHEKSATEILARFEIASKFLVKDFKTRHNIT